MRAYHSSAKIKEQRLMQVLAHEKADEIIKGIYWGEGKGCAVGCTIHSSDHAAYETELGIPIILARLEDGIFEGLPNELAKSWPRRFLEAIEPGADLSLVWPKFATWLLGDPEHGVVKFAKTEKQREAIQAVADLYQRISNGETIERAVWLEVRDAAYAATAYTAYATYAATYAATAAAYTAAATADAATAATATAADAAAADATYAAADATAARSKARTIQSEKLLELLREVLNE